MFHMHGRSSKAPRLFWGHTCELIRSTLFQHVLRSTARRLKIRLQSLFATYSISDESKYVDAQSALLSVPHAGGGGPAGRTAHKMTASTSTSHYDQVFCMHQIVGSVPFFNLCKTKKNRSCCLIRETSEEAASVIFMRESHDHFWQKRNRSIS